MAGTLVLEGSSVVDLWGRRWDYRAAQGARGASLPDTLEEEV